MNLNLTNQIRNAFRLRPTGETQRVKQGIYHYRREAGGNVTRFHLRVEENGSGLLVANASAGAMLSRSGVWIAKALLEEKNREEIKASLLNHFRVPRKEQVGSDIEKLNEFIQTLANPEDNYPIFNFDDPELSTPRRFFAPFHAQVRIGSPQVIRPLLDRLWNSGFLHITLAAGRNDSAEDGVHCVERAEDMGMICGVRASGTWLQTPDLFGRLAMAGVDYVVMPVVSSRRERHDAFLRKGDFERVLRIIALCKEMEVCPVAEIPLYKGSVEELSEILECLRAQGVHNVQYYAVAGEPVDSALSRVEIIQAAVKVEESAESADVRYVWQVPVFRKGDLGTIFEAGPRTPEDLSILLEHDGSVHLSRGSRSPAGNLLRHSWKEIWNGDVCRQYRKRILSPTHCDLCPGLAICAADCPGESSSWAREES